MFNGLNVFKMAHAAASHAATRQAVIARNIANADTPGFNARDVRPFSDVIDHGVRHVALKATRSSHLNSTIEAAAFEARETPGSDESPNKNNVSIETELLKAAETKKQHDRALAVYRFSLNVLRASLGRG